MTFLIDKKKHINWEAYLIVNSLDINVIGVNWWESQSRNLQIRKMGALVEKLKETYSSETIIFTGGLVESLTNLILRAVNPSC